MPHVALLDIFTCAKGLPIGHPEREEIVYVAGGTVPDELALALAHPPVCGVPLLDAAGDVIGVCKADSTHGGHFNGEGRCSEHKTDDHEPLPERRWLIEDGLVRFVDTAPPLAPLTHAQYIAHLARRSEETSDRIVEITATEVTDLALSPAPEAPAEPAPESVEVQPEPPVAPVAESEPAPEEPQATAAEPQPKAAAPASEAPEPVLAEAPAPDASEPGKE